MKTPAAPDGRRFNVHFPFARQRLDHGDVQLNAVPDGGVNVLLPACRIWVSRISASPSGSFHIKSGTRRCNAPCASSTPSHTQYRVRKNDPAYSAPPARAVSAAPVPVTGWRLTLPVNLSPDRQPATPGNDAANIRRHSPESPSCRRGILRHDLPDSPGRQAISTLCGCASALFSLASAAAVTGNRQNRN